jgi:methyl-accepting chemotaxis protein
MFKRLKDIKMKTKLLAVFILIGIFPVAVLGIFTVMSSGETLSQQAYNQLVSIRDLKKSQIESFFQSRTNDIGTMAENPFTVRAVKELDKAFEAEDGIEGKKFTGNANGRYNAPENYRKVHDTFYPVFKNYMEKYGFQDIILMCPDHGDTYFTIAKHSDFGKRARNTDSPLKTVWRQAVQTGNINISDISPYAPAENMPAQFIAAPVKEDGKLIGVLAYELSSENINDIMQERSGMGRTAESYLVGPDKLMRSESYLDPENRSVTASFENPASGSVVTETSALVLSGQAGKKITANYNGNTVFSAYTPVKFGDITWGLITEIDKTEALESLKKLELITVIIALGAMAVVILLAYVLSMSITNPIKKGVEMAHVMAKGDLTQRLDIDQKDEIGVLAKALNNMSDGLQNMFSEVSEGVSTLAASTTEMSTASDQITSSSKETADRSDSVASAAEEMSTNMDNVAAAVEQTSSNIQMIVSASEEMSSTIQEIADNTARGNETTSDAVEKAKQVSQKVNELGEAAGQINKVTETIADISEQTNLLALNATIEAARAGEAGKGFSIVAQEIKELAGQTAEATNDIGNKIAEVQVTTSESVTAIEAIVDVINEINEVVTTVATSLEEQASTTQEISNNVSQAASGVQEVNENINQASSATRDVTTEIADVSQATKDISSGSSQVNQSAWELSKLSETLGDMVKKFKI